MYFKRREPDENGRNGPLAIIYVISGPFHGVGCNSGEKEIGRGKFR